MPTRNIAAAFAAGIEEHLFLELRPVAPMYTRVFDVETSDKKYEDFFSWQTYGPPKRKEPGIAWETGEALPSFGKRFIHDTYALGDMIPEEDWDDDEYGVLHRLLAMKGGGMATAFKTFYEVQHFGYFSNLGFQSGNNVMGSPDGVGLFSLSHPVSAGLSNTFYANRPAVDVDLSISSYQQAAISIKTQYAPNNYTIENNKIKTLVVNPQEEYIAKQILKGQWERGTSDRNENFIRDEDVDLVVAPYFIKSGATGRNNAWFVVGERAHLKSFMRLPYKVTSFFDGFTLSYVFAARTRFSFGHIDARGVYGSPGA